MYIFFNQRKESCFEFRQDKYNIYNLHDELPKPSFIDAKKSFRYKKISLIK